MTWRDDKEFNMANAIPVKLLVHWVPGAKSPLGISKHNFPQIGVDEKGFKKDLS